MSPLYDSLGLSGKDTKPQSLFNSDDVDGGDEGDGDDDDEDDNDGDDDGDGESSHPEYISH